jgi:hypothetical protein
VEDDFGAGGRPDIDGNFGTGPYFSYDWGVIVSGSVFFFTWVLTSQSLASWLDPRGIENENENEGGIGYLSAHPVSVSVKGPCYKHEGNNGIAVPLGTPVRVGHRANAVESDCESDASGPSEPEGLTDGSSEDDTVAPGGRVKRIVKGIEKLRRVWRVRRPRPFVPIRKDCEDEPPGLNPSSEEDSRDLDYHDSDNDSVDDLFPDDDPTSRASFSGADSKLESSTGIATPNTPDQSTTLRPSPIEVTAIAVCSYAFSECEDFGSSTRRVCWLVALQH